MYPLYCLFTSYSTLRRHYRLVNVCLLDMSKNILKTTLTQTPEIMPSVGIIPLDAIKQAGYEDPVVMMKELYELKDISALEHIRLQLHDEKYGKTIVDDGVRKHKIIHNIAYDNIRKVFTPSRVAAIKKFFAPKRIACVGTFFNVFLMSLDSKSCVQLEQDETLDDVFHRYNLSFDDYWFSFNDKPIRLDVPLKHYNIYESCSIICHPRLRGGQSTPSYRLYTHVLECEKQVCSENLVLQHEIVTELYEQFLSQLASCKQTLFNQSTEWLLGLVEDFVQSLYWFGKCTTKKDYMLCIMLSYKLLTRRSASTQVVNFLLSDENLLQGDFEDYVLKARKAFDFTKSIASNPLLSKAKGIYTFLLVQGFLTRFGLEITEKEFIVLNKKSDVDYTCKTSLALASLDSAIFICEKICDYRLTGDISVVLHTEAVYKKWLDESERIINLAPFTSNLEAHNTTYFSFLSDLNDCIEKGSAICKYSTTNNGIESLTMRKRLSSLQMLKNIEVTRRASQKERKAPFGVLIHGCSSVGKSTFTKMLYYYYGGLHGLNTDDHFRYVRSPTDEYWSNFDSSKWCIQMDDIAFLLPNKSSDVDPTLKEMLNVINNVPYVPPQAALEDKGRTPVMAKLVVATTNAKDLNALDYFYCPLAVRRRLPYVVNIVPKKEFLSENKKFINPSSLSPIEGDYPDYWEIEVQALVPISMGGRDSAKLETVAKFSDVKAFLKHFGQASREHEENQEKSSTCDVKMKDIKVCKLCFETGDTCQCLQSYTFYIFDRVLTQYLYVTISSWINIFLAWQLSVYTLTRLGRFRLFRMLCMWFANHFSSGVQMRMQILMCEARQNRRFRVALGIMLSVSAILTGYYCFKQGNSEDSRPRQKSKEESDEELREQSEVQRATEDQLAKETTSNVWYNSALELNRFDVPVASQSVVALSDSQYRDIFAANCVHLDVQPEGFEGAVRTGGFFAKGNFLFFNKHVLNHGESYRMKIVDMTESQGLTSNITVFFKKSDVKFLPERDLVCLQVKSTAPRKDILKYWNDSDIYVTRMLAIRRTKVGEVTHTPLYNAVKHDNFPIEALNTSMPIYMATSSIPTKAGDCGALGVAITPRGPVILGIHTVGYNFTSGYPHVMRTDLESMIASFETIVVEGGGTPVLSLNSDVKLVEPHHKSLFRYIKQGTVRIYGSFPGFRPKPKSRVCDTPLIDEMCKHFNYEVGFGKPVMDGWEPWRKNIVEMIEPRTNIDHSILKHNVKTFTSDIISGLNKKHGDEWKKQLLFLSREASVNGLPGVKFIDRLNVSTSMGHPWNTTKRKYLVSTPSTKYPEGVDFGEEVWSKVDAIEKLYSEGKRAYSIFTGTLKDEATALSKILDKKTRMFTGGPVDWSLVVRSKLLSFVRLLQKNKFIFEAGPGTVCQSTEWTDIHDYLTFFGKDRIVAGDYGKFDKRMSSDFILSAFEIICNIHKEAGFSENECRQIMCIGYDVAFPMVNVNGDLVEFYGTNPSGHPLTVIINSLVNSLYMRYAWTLANPDGNSDTFSQKVNLFTYGDDNIMGVSRDAEFFNHTAIQKSLAKIGVEYTMADKTSESVPFIRISECSFLKRTWRYDEDMETFLCPLEETSIHKSLTKWVPSKSIDEFAQMVAVISSANMEYFFYGREVFEKHHAFFKGVLAQEPYLHYVNNSTLPSWAILAERFRKASDELQNS